MENRIFRYVIILCICLFPAPFLMGIETGGEAGIVFPLKGNFIAELEITATGGGENPVYLTLFHKEEQSLSLIRGPSSEKGKALLKNDDGAFIYYPLLNELTKLRGDEEINPFHQFASFLFAENRSWEVRQAGGEKLGKYDTLISLLTPGESSGFIHIKNWTASMEKVPLKQEYYRQEKSSSKIFKKYTVHFLRWYKSSGITFPAEWVVTDNGKQNRQIRFLLIDMTLTESPEYIFTGTFLRYISGNQ